MERYIPKLSDTNVSAAIIKISFITLSQLSVILGLSLQLKEHMTVPLKKVLIVGSAPDAVRAAEWDTSFFTHTLVINNAWKAFSSWDTLIFPEDFPAASRPTPDQMVGKKWVTAREFVPVQNEFGGFVYAGGTMCFTAGYWALGALQPDVIAYLGCDMVYESQAGSPTHFYGQGKADPLRPDVTLQSLEAKSLRLLALAQDQGCSVVNLSQRPKSRLMIPRINLQALQDRDYRPHKLPISTQAVKAALLAESQLGYWVPSGRYWEESERFDKLKLSHIDALWQATATNTECQAA